MQNEHIAGLDNEIESLSRQIKEEKSFLEDMQKRRIELEMYRDTLGFFRREERKQFEEGVLAKFIRNIKKQNIIVKKLQNERNNLEKENKTANYQCYNSENSTCRIANIFKEGTYKKQYCLSNDDSERKFCQKQMKMTTENWIAHWANWYSKNITFNNMKMALSQSRIDVAEVLWQKRESDFSINAVDEKGFSLIHFAALDSNKAAVKWLLNKGANINIGEKNGQTSIHILAASDKTDTNKMNMIEYLIKECGANTETTDNEGRTPVFLAFMAKNIEAIKCLNKFGAKVDVYDSSGLKPIFCAVSSDDVDFFESLKTVFSPNVFSDLLKSRAKNGMPLSYMANQLNLIELEEWLKKNNSD